MAAMHVTPGGVGSDDPWESNNAPVDARLRLLYKLVLAGDDVACRRLVGPGAFRISKDDQGSEEGALSLEIPLLHELTRQQITTRTVDPDSNIPPIYLQKDIVPARVPGRIKLKVRRNAVETALKQDLTKRLGQFQRVSLPEIAHPMLEETLPDLEPPQDWHYEGVDLDGQGIVVGIIDDGCGFAHRHFVSKAAPFTSRCRFLWDQTPRDNAPSPEWTTLPEFKYGYELDNKNHRHIDAALAANAIGNVIDEDAVYAALGYEARPSQGGIPSHGTHVTDVAAGAGGTFARRRGVAPNADIIFVQLPRATVEEPDHGVLESCIRDGVEYIFKRATQLGGRAVINISYGGYCGPHDGTSDLEESIDAVLDEQPDRAVVISAGNGFEGDCHIQRTVAVNGDVTLRWITHPGDHTLNLMEIWYPNTGKLTVEVKHPSASSRAVELDEEADIVTNGGAGPEKVGEIQHRNSSTRNNDKCVLISLHATDDPGSAALRPAPAGIWEVLIKNKRNAPSVRIDAWIEHDRSARRGMTRFQQSRFHVDDSEPRSTLGSLANGHNSIVVGAYNAHSQTVARYSACGPTRPTGRDSGRPKPDIYAPGASDFRGSGVLCAEVLSGLPRRMNGTSIAAPHVTGLIALVMQFVRERGCSLTAVKLRDVVLNGATPISALSYDRAHQLGPRRVKQSHAWPDLVPRGKVNLLETLNKAKDECS